MLYFIYYLYLSGNNHKSRFDTITSAARPLTRTLIGSPKQQAEDKFF